MFGIKLPGSKQDQWEDFEAEAMPHKADLYRVAVWLTRSQTEAEDLVQETLMQALKSFHRYEPGTNCRAWLTTILYHLNSKRRYKLGRLKIVDDPEETLAATVAFEPQLPQTITDEEVLAALRSVPENFRQVIVLSDVEGFSYKEISAILEIPMGTVMSRLSRGRKVLRQELAAYAHRYGFGEKLKNAAG